MISTRRVGDYVTIGLPLDASGSGIFSIPEIVRLAGEGSIRVPKFQRSFVWKAKDVLRLFDSIYRGFPIGTILLWRHDAPAGEVELGPIKFAVQETTNALWVVDGQQRITSLFGALSPDWALADDRFEVYFDLSSSKFTNPRRGVLPRRALPVREALETRSLLTWLRTHGDDLEVPDFDLADRLGGALRDYKVPAYIVSGNDQKILREVFDRVNSAGRPITRAQVFHALFASEAEPGSPAAVVAGLKRFAFGALDENRIVQSLLAIRGGDVLRDVHDEFTERDDPADWYDRTEVALEQTIGFLRGEGVEHLSLMPNTLPIPVLAAFFQLHSDPPPWVLRLLSRWLWRGWVHGFGKEGDQAAHLRRAARDVNPKRLGPEEDTPTAYEAVKGLLESVVDAPAPVLSLDNFRTNAARGRLILLALASLRPLDVAGEPIDLAHQLEQHGVSAITEFVSEHRLDAAARGFWPVDAAPVTGREDQAILTSHAITAPAASSLAARDTEGFLRHRRAALRELVPRFLASRMEIGSLVRPPLDELIVADAGDRD
jgi:Protein of unknown function DUF262